MRRARTARPVEREVDRQMPPTPGLPPRWHVNSAATQGATAEAEWLTGVGGDAYGDKTKPRVKLTGQDGNIYFIMARCEKAARRAGWDEHRRRAVMKRIQDAPSYHEALGVVSDEFDAS